MVASGHEQHIGIVSAGERMSAYEKRYKLSHLGLSQKCSKLNVGKLQSMFDGRCSALLLELGLIYSRIIIYSLFFWI